MRAKEGCLLVAFRKIRPDTSVIGLGAKLRRRFHASVAERFKEDDGLKTSNLHGYLECYLYLPSYSSHALYGVIRRPG